MITTTSPRYLRPGRFLRRVGNPLIELLVRRGFGPRGARQLAVRGRRSGEWRTVPVNPLHVDGVQYLVAPRGTTEWVRNLRAAGGGELRLGGRAEVFAATELDDIAKPPIIREYLRRWKFEVGRFFESLDESSSDEDLLAVAAGFPVFRLSPAG